MTLKGLYFIDDGIYYIPEEIEWNPGDIIPAYEGGKNWEYKFSMNMLENPVFIMNFHKIKECRYLEFSKENEIPTSNPKGFENKLNQPDFRRNL